MATSKQKDAKRKHRKRKERERQAARALLADAKIKTLRLLDREQGLPKEYRDRL
jgi:hypothetical protein